MLVNVEKCISHQVSPFKHVNDKIKQRSIVFFRLKINWLNGRYILCFGFDCKKIDHMIKGFYVYIYLWESVRSTWRNYMHEMCLFTELDVKTTFGTKNIGLYIKMVTLFGWIGKKLLKTGLKISIRNKWGGLDIQGFAKVRFYCIYDYKMSVLILL